MQAEVKREALIHDYDNLQSYLISKCPECESPYNNAEDSTCLKCNYKFYRKGFEPKGMSDEEINYVLKRRNKNEKLMVKNEKTPIKESLVEKNLPKEKKHKTIKQKLKALFIIKNLKSKYFKEKIVNLKNDIRRTKFLTLIFLVCFFTSSIFFTYIAIFKFDIIFGDKSILANYYLLQFEFIKKNWEDILFLSMLAPLFLWLYLIVQKRDSIKRLAYSYLIILCVSLLGFNFAYLEMRAFALGDVLIERIKINKNHTAENIYWDTSEILDKLRNQHDPPKIIRGKDNITKQAILFVLDAKNRTSFYEQQVLPSTLNFFSPKISVPENSAFIMAENNLLIIKFDSDALGVISPTLAKLMVQKEISQRHVKSEPDMTIMGKQEYSQFREDQINGRIAKLDDALVKVTKVVNAYYAAVATDKSNINYNISQSDNAFNKGNSVMNSCILEQDCTYNYVPGYCSSYLYFCTSGYSYKTCKPRYSYYECANKRDFYWNLSDRYISQANEWKYQLNLDQHELSIYLGVKEIFETYKAMAMASKEDIPFELGLFTPPSDIKIVLNPDDKIETLADYFGTVVHEYFHYTSYLSDESSLPTFFEEGLTEYFARKAIKDTMGIETNEGYPLIVKVIERMMEKIPEKDFQDIYFSKSSDALASMLDNKFGKDFYKNNELYFEYISYIPPKKSLDITNNILEKIGAQKLTEEDLFSKGSNF